VQPATAEHDGGLVRFHPRFLAFAREYNFVSRACNPASGWEKGKWNAAASDTHARISGHCVNSPTCTM
jgi:transposase